jgi:uncharacterized protein HemY
LLESALAKARSQEKSSHEAELLARLGKLAAQTGHRQQALTYLEGAGQFATSVQFYRNEADAMYELAQHYRDAGDLATAEARATQVGDRYYVPRNLIARIARKVNQAVRGTHTRCQELWDY